VAFGLVDDWGIGQKMVLSAEEGFTIRVERDYVELRVLAANMNA
jgi:hypothetical protein